MVPIGTEDSSDTAHGHRPMSTHFKAWSKFTGLRVKEHGHCQSRHRKQVRENVESLTGCIVGQRVCFFGHGLPTGIRFVNVAGKLDALQEWSQQNGHRQWNENHGSIVINPSKFWPFGRSGQWTHQNRHPVGCSEEITAAEPG